MPKLKPYPKYKPTNIQWLGNVPDHWKVLKLRHILTNVRTERNRPDLPLLSVVREKGVILRDITSKDENHNIIPEDLSNYKVVRKGQFAMNKMKAWQGSYGVSKHTGIVSPAYFVFDINRISADYFHIAVRSKACVPFFAQASDGVRIAQWDLSQTRMKEIPIPLPPLDEQRAIARYLDHITSRIDTYTSNKRKLVDLLKEYRQALIHQTVTRGLNPDERDSGVESMIRLHYLITVNSGARIQFEPDKEDMDAAVSIGGEHIQNYEFSLGDKTRFVPLSFYLDQKSGHIQHGDTLVVKDGATIGKSMFVDHMPAEHMMVNEHVFVLRAVSIDPRYLSFLIQEKTTQDTIWSLVYGAAQPGLSKNFVKFIRVPCVDLEEQRAIADYLDRKTDKIDTAIELAQREIELLEEYRTRLIADVVTGQLDVRDQNVPATPA